uniref:Uncharacterized protein n=1 Tax=Odontella aurita TaxID=265563 RepID=A0A7S4K4I7_9STRA|mmetsp:Transcript_61515/g.181810  ORF Transcript_61515/g.181810 Transcript_61515/m.181810 type:complete len:311 (+) Transcript_61515:299-1231(+)|eukprot:CAMPEP_0113535974 /NCGR_PEP_ID=MMETSP0015_2-20120614/6002_1 /TAXON_ID=2838 /ORGANISM="Odontella" /LENGTH=310 /DNA_ID=CAMNT_0000435285 /DNA_START=79 /DNA_END=1011 /DNA_ORIENTATION=- /assembly_acc=CAM_ASM_000160
MNNPSSHPRNEPGTQNPCTPRQTRVEEEVAVFETFASVVQRKFADASNLERLDSLYKSPAYSREKATLTAINNNGMAWGLGIGLGTFVALRKAPPAIVRYMRSSRRSQMERANSAYNFNASATQSPFERSAPDQHRRPGIIFRTFKLGLDMFASMSVAMYFSVFFADRKKLLRDISEVPLVEGRSLISDELCSDFIQTYQEISKETWSTYRGKSDVIDGIENFVLNCKKRELFEAQVRAERGLKPGGTAEHLSIPPPGVPRDLDVSVGDTPHHLSFEEFDGDLEAVNDKNNLVSDWRSFDDFEGDRPGDK